MEAANSFDDSEMGQAAIQKAKDLFCTCDVEDKGFIIKRDMQRLKDEMPALTPDQLEEVFDSLDQDKNGYLTMDEFVRGFDEPDHEPEAQVASLADELYGAKENEVVEQEHFDQLMDRIGAADVINDKDAVRDMWSKLRHDDPQLINNFEGFLAGISKELHRKKDDVNCLESAVEQQNQSHEKRIQQLYEEMEQQIKDEKERAAKEERERAEKQREEMEQELAERDSRIQDILKNHQELESKLKNLDGASAQTVQEKEELEKERAAFLKEKLKMERELEGTRQSYEEYKDALEVMRQKAIEEKRARAKATFQVSQKIASEREDLVQALDDLRSRNQQLRDARDESTVISSSRNGNDLSLQDELGRQKFGNERQNVAAGNQSSGAGLSLADELGGLGGGPIHGLVNAPRIEDMQIENEDEDEMVAQSGALDLRIATVHPQQQRTLAAELGQQGRQHSHKQTGQMQAFGVTTDSESDTTEYSTPDRIYKVVFVGDSGVGKTCFLHRFCYNKFKPTFSATIGVDFTVKSLRVGDRVIALQLWDTAGQERFRSITKQYFRKADGVVLMYDVTSELSFINIRSWMNSVREGTEENCVVSLVGNKVDVCEDEESRGVRFKDGQALADEFQCLFFETSAHDGSGIVECMKAMAVHLQEREDQHLEQALKLSDMTVEKRRKCCKS